MNRWMDGWMNAICSQIGMVDQSSPCIPHRIPHLFNILTPSIHPIYTSIYPSIHTGADIANICNEAAIVAARRNKSAVDLSDFEVCMYLSYGWIDES